MLTLSGTVSMSYMGADYNIPVDVYLPPPYPIRPPVAFVRPTAGMMVKENHRHVAADGMVYMSYLHEWRPHSHNLVEMAVTMSSLFGASPPVFARPASGGQQPTTTPVSGGGPPPAAATPSPPPSYGDLTASRAEEDRRIDADRIARAKFQEEIDMANSAAAAIRKAEDEEKRLRELESRTEDEARRTLTACLQSSLLTRYGQMRDGIREDMRDQKKLELGRDVIDRRVTYLRDRRDQLEKAVGEADEATAKIRSLLESHPSSTSADSKEESADDLALPRDVLSSQMLLLSAENGALGDALYHIDRALAKGTVDLVVYMKVVRRLARRQFLARAHLIKVGQIVAAEKKGVC